MRRDSVTSVTRFFRECHFVNFTYYIYFSFIYIIYYIYKRELLYAEEWIGKKVVTLVTLSHLSIKVFDFSFDISLFCTTFAST